MQKCFFLERNNGVILGVNEHLFYLIQAARSDPIMSTLSLFLSSVFRNVREKFHHKGTTNTLDHR